MSIRAFSVRRSVADCVGLVWLDEHDEVIARGRSALARGEWVDARALFAEALARSETRDAYEGLGIAARYELDAEAAIDAHERGYRLARSHGDTAAAARRMIWKRAHLRPERPAGRTAGR
jgi:hypothetical protein